MKIAITHTRYIARGGVERYIYDLVRRLLAEGHEVHFFCHFWDDEVLPDVVLHRIPNHWKAVRFMKVRHYDAWLREHVRREDFDIVHGFSKSSSQDIYTDGSGCLLDYQAYSIAEGRGGTLRRTLKRHGLYQREVLAIEKRRHKRGNFLRIVTMADLCKDQIQRRYGLNDNEVVTIYNGIDTERFQPSHRAALGAEARERFGIPADAFVALCIGNDYHRKGVPTLIDTAELLKREGFAGDRKPLIAVVGNERPAMLAEIKADIESRGLADIIQIFGPQKEIDAWHALSDAFVLPTRFDAFGNVVLEALATGVPPIVARAAGAAELIEHDVNGWVLEDPRDAQTIAGHLRALAADPGLAQRMGQAARSTAEQCSWERHFQSMLALYDEVASEKKQLATVSAQG